MRRAPIGERKAQARKVRAIARARGKAAPREISPTTAEQLKHSGKGRFRDLQGGRVLVRCVTCGVSVLDERDQRQGHLERAHGGVGGFREVGA